MQHPAEHSPLGKPSEYVSTYSPELLFPISRATKWAELGLDVLTPLDDAIRITARHAAPQRPN